MRPGRPRSQEKANETSWNKRRETDRKKVALGLALDTQISFVKDATGSVTSLIFHNPGGKNIPGNKVK